VLLAATFILWPRLTRNENVGTPSLRWEQLTNFNDAAEIPTLSHDGKLVGFLRGPGGSEILRTRAKSGSNLWPRRTLPTHEDPLETDDQFLVGQQPVYFTQMKVPYLEHLRTAAARRAGTEAVHG